MGVPGFVVWIRKFFNDEMILSNLPNSSHILYIDGNCLIHPKCFEILEQINNNTMSGQNISQLMFQSIVSYIDFLVKYVKPKICYFAVDGVGPAAKINQQRYRRYKAMHDTDVKNKIKNKHGIMSNVEWSNTVITPGTEFMKELDEYLLKYFNSAKNVNYIYSSHLVPGEGEHKIMDHLRSNVFNNETCVIYGLDADLFFLSLANGKNNLFLLREEQYINNNSESNKQINLINEIELRYVSIDILKQCYNSKIEEMTNNSLNKRTTKVFYKDFIFVCYLLGNDFIPHLPSIDIKNNGLDILLDKYIKVLIEQKNDLIIFDANCDVSINMEFLKKLLKILGNEEQTHFSNTIYKNKQRIKNKKCPIDIENDKYKKEIWELENLKNIEQYDFIKLGYGAQDVWKYKYYEYYFGATQHNTEFIDLICKTYLEGLVWITKYYYKGCPSWKWKYSFTHAPFISDISEYLEKNNFDINSINFGASMPLQPEQQLLAVMPASCINIIPKEYQHLMKNDESPILDMYPKSIKFDYLYKTMYWTCIPMLPYLDIDRITNATKDIKSKYNIAKEIYINL